MSASELLVAGDTCATVVTAPRSGLLVDGRDFYSALYHALSRARKSIFMAGWQFASNVELLRGEDAAGAALPTDFIGFLRALCERNPELEIHLLAWDASPVFAFERQPLQKLTFHWRGHKRIHFLMDNCHPAGGSQHQKLVTVDRSIAFVGGMDICTGRWDDRAHEADDPRRVNGRKPYHPYHDVQAYLTGDAVDVLRAWFADRWRLAGCAALGSLDAPREEVPIEPTLEIDAPAIGLSRTWPEMEACPLPQTRELRNLHLRALDTAERLIYIENQYVSCDEIERVLVQRMERVGAPKLDIVIVLPDKSAGFKERVSIGVYQAKIMRTLGEAAARHGHHLGVYYQAARKADGTDVPVFIHAKVLAVDDRFLLVSSANATNRSMSFDSELGVAWEDRVPNRSIRRARVELMREHAGLGAEEAVRVLQSPDGLVDRLDALAHARTHRLRIHKRNADEVPGPLLRRFVPDDPPFDPDHIEDLLPEPGAWLDKIFRKTSRR
ncbi:MAG TPA: phospholipase D-like domain-containing protein [Kofleriaceae bacterium]|nr:phospholipase D-like domain-containing protein [Kofleriaceae bacterium]